MSEIKPTAWLCKDYPPFLPKGQWAWRLTMEEPVNGLGDALIKLSDHQVEIARVEEQLRDYQMAADAEANEVDKRGLEIKRLRKVVSAAREVAGWFTSGNDVPVDGVHQLKISSHSIMDDVHALNVALSSLEKSE